MQLKKYVARICSLIICEGISMETGGTTYLNRFPHYM